MAKSAVTGKSFADYAEDKSWEGNGFEPLPDVTAIFDLTKGEIKKANSGFWMLALQFKVVECEEDESLVDRVHFMNLMFENKNGWNPFMVKKFYESIGYEVPEFKDMENSIEELVDSGLRISATLETAKGYQNTIINEVLDSEESEEAESDLPTEDEIKSWDKEKLVEFAKENDIKLDSKLPKKMAAQIIEWVNEQSEEAEEESEEADDEEAKTREALINFMKNSGVEEGDDCDDETSIDDIKEILSEYTFEEKDMLPEEIKLIESIGLGKIIERAKAAPAKKAAKKK